MFTLEENTSFVKRLRNGDHICFNHIYVQMSDIVFRNIKRLVHDDTEAEDILQDVFVTLWNNRAQLLFEQKIDGWLFYTSYYKSMEFLKKSIRHHIVLMNDGDQMADIKESESAVDEHVYAQRVEILRAGIDQLSNQRKEAFVLCRMQGLSYNDAAETMGISPQSVKDYVKMATKLVRKYALLNDPTMTVVGLYFLTEYLK